MTTRLTSEQLGQLVAEFERLSQRREAELDRQQVEEILQELKLPTDRLDDALMQLQRREVLATRQRRNRWILGGAIATISFSTIQQKNTLRGDGRIFRSLSVYRLLGLGRSPSCKRFSKRLSGDKFLT